MNGNDVVRDHACTPVEHSGLCRVCGGYLQEPLQLTPVKRFERICRSTFPRTIMVNYNDLSKDEIVVFSLREKLTYEQITRYGADAFDTAARYCDKDDFYPTNEVEILDVPRVGSVWEMMHGKLLIIGVGGTKPEEIKIYYKDLFYVNDYEERPPVDFALWCSLRVTGLLLAVD